MNLLIFIIVTFCCISKSSQDILLNRSGSTLHKCMGGYHCVSKCCYIPQKSSVGICIPNLEGFTDDLCYKPSNSVGRLKSKFQTIFRDSPKSTDDSSNPSADHSETNRRYQFPPANPQQPGSLLPGMPPQQAGGQGTLLPSLPPQLVTVASKGTTVTGAYVYSCSSCDTGCCCGTACCDTNVCTTVGSKVSTSVVGTLCTGCTSFCCCGQQCCAPSFCGLNIDTGATRTVIGDNYNPPPAPAAPGIQTAGFTGYPPLTGYNPAPQAGYPGVGGLGPSGYPIGTQMTGYNPTQPGFTGFGDSGPSGYAPTVGGLGPNDINPAQLGVGYPNLQGRFGAGFPNFQGAQTQGIDPAGGDTALYRMAQLLNSGYLPNRFAGGDMAGTGNNFAGIQPGMRNQFTPYQNTLQGYPFSQLGTQYNPYDASGTNQAQFGQGPFGQGQLGPGPGQFGPAQGQFGPGQGQFGPNQGQFGPNQGQFGLGQGQFGPNRGQFGQGQFGSNRGPFGQGQFGQGQGRFGQGQFGPRQPQRQFGLQKRSANTQWPISRKQRQFGGYGGGSCGGCNSGCCCQSKCCPCERFVVAHPVSQCNNCQCGCCGLACCVCKKVYQVQSYITRACSSCSCGCCENKCCVCTSDSAISVTAVSSGGCGAECGCGCCAGSCCSCGVAGQGVIQAIVGFGGGCIGDGCGGLSGFSSGFGGCGGQSCGCGCCGTSCCSCGGSVIQVGYVSGCGGQSCGCGCCGSSCCSCGGGGIYSLGSVVGLSGGCVGGACGVGAVAGYGGGCGGQSCGCGCCGSTCCTCGGGVGFGGFGSIGFGAGGCGGQSCGCGCCGTACCSCGGGFGGAGFGNFGGISAGALIG